MPPCNLLSPRGGVVCRVLTSSLLVLSALLAGSSSLQAAKTPEPAKKDGVPEGVSASDWQSIRAAHEAWQHAIEPVKGGWQARNATQQWTTKFDGRGFEAKPQSADWTWGLELRSYGAGDEQREVSGKPVVKSEGHRLAYHWDGTVQEWFVNDGRGLEHGFSVQERPPGPSDAPLTFVLATRGPLRAAVTGDARAVDYRDKSGATVLTYSGLRVWDAEGRELAARFAPAKDGVTLQVDAKDARYPLLIDPIAQQAYLKRYAVEPNKTFGRSVSVSGNTAAIGGNDGVCVYVRSGGTWTQQAYLKGSNTQAGDVFGAAVAISGDTLVVGAYSEDGDGLPVGSPANNNNAVDAGAAYVFTRTAGVWTQQAYLKASNAQAGDYFGISVAVSGETVVVGANGEDGNAVTINGDAANNAALEAGAAYVFTRTAGVWTQQAYVKASNAEAGDYFGTSVAIDGNTVVVGANGENSIANTVNGDQSDNTYGDSGAAYVFTRSGTNWTQQAYLKAFNRGPGDSFGQAVSISGNLVVVGAPNEASNATTVNGNGFDDSAMQAGAAYVFRRTGESWAQEAYLKASNTGAGDRFGYSVGVSGETVIAGAWRESSGTMGVNTTPNESAAQAGAAYVFTRTMGVWSQQAYLKAWNTTERDYFGESVAVSGETVLAGARLEDGDGSASDNNMAPDSGAGYAFVRTAGVWTQQAYLKGLTAPGFRFFGESVALSGNTLVATAIPAFGGESRDVCVFVRDGSTWSLQAVLNGSNTEGADAFGNSSYNKPVAISGDTVVVGAFAEDGDGTGGGTVDNNFALDSGAAYVFVRSAGVWTQQAYLKALNVGAGDNFGASVDISGDTVVIGARTEDSNATGVQGNELDNSALDSGAAYVFQRSGLSWTQQAYLKASNTGAGDGFGDAVAISGDIVVVGAFFEDSNGVGGEIDNSRANSGAAYVFERGIAGWSQRAYLKASDPGAFDYFGSAVAVSGETVAVGAYAEDGDGLPVGNPANNNNANDAGAVYVFTRSGTSWSQQAYLKASNAGADDWFGESLAMSGDLLVAGAKQEEGNGSTPGDNSARFAGAAYVFLRGGTTWFEQAYLKASNADAGDIFGAAVAVSDNTVAVGAPYEDGDGSQLDNNNSATAGAVYVFTGFGPAPVIGGATTASGQVGSFFSHQISATAPGGVDSYAAAILPAGLSVNAGTGLISGFPAVAGTFPITLTATNPGGTGTTTLTLTVNPQPAISPGKGKKKKSKPKKSKPKKGKKR